MDEYGETPMFYIWPKGHEEGTALPENFYERVRAVLEAIGFESEAV